MAHETRISDAAGFIRPLAVICQTPGSTVLAVTLTEDPEDPTYYEIRITCFSDEDISLERQSNILTEVLLAVQGKIKQLSENA